jgi:mono/diheme cytochrome c family protein
MTGITPGQPYNSKIYTAIIGVYLNSMPPGKPINENQRTLIKLWIEQGAKNNSESDTITKKDTSKTNVPVGSACFSRDVLPVVLANCSKCHSSLTSYNGIMQIVSAGNPSNSTLYQDITASGKNAMPPSYKLPQVNIDSIYSWIINGAKNGTCSTTCDTTQYNFKAQVMPIFNVNCIGCHSGNAPQGNILLDDYTSITTAVNNGKLLSSLKNKTMPSISPLSDCNTTVIEKWMNAGAKNN